MSEQEYVQKILEQLAETYGVSPELVMSSSRLAPATEARHVLAYHLRQHGWELKRIGTVLGRDHSTIHHAVQQVTRRLATDRALATLLAALPRMREGARTEQVRQLRAMAVAYETAARQLREAADHIERLDEGLDELPVELRRVQ